MSSLSPHPEAVWGPQRDAMMVLKKLHSFTMDRKEVESALMLWEDIDEAISFPHVVLGGGHLIDEDSTPRPDVSKRQATTDRLESLGVGRPAHAHSNSRERLQYA